MMDKESWLSAEQAVEYGFATKVYEEKTEGANQSSMPLIQKKLLNQSNPEGIAPVQYSQIDIPSAKEIAQEVYNLVKDNVTIKTEEINVGSPWATFFGGK